MVSKAAIKFQFLRFCQRWRGATANDAIPDGLNQLDFLISIEHTCLL